MGCTDSNHILPPNVPQQHLSRVPRYLLKLIQVSDVSHQLNVNKKYEYLSKLDTSQHVG